MTKIDDAKVFALHLQTFVKGMCGPEGRCADHDRNTESNNTMFNVASHNGCSYQWGLYERSLVFRKPAVKKMFRLPVMA